MSLQLIPTAEDIPIRRAWASVLAGLAPPEAAFGPEVSESRPRHGDAYYLITEERPMDAGAGCGDLAVVGLAWLQAPAPTTRVFAFGLARSARGRGLGPQVKDSLLALCFAQPDVFKVETAVYSSNDHSLQALHAKHGVMAEEGRQRATIRIGDTYYDRVLFGLTRAEYARITNKEEQP